MHQIFEARYQIKEFEPNITSPALFTTPCIALTFNYLQTGIVKIFVKYLVSQKKGVPLRSGKSYTTSSPRTPPGLDRSNGRGL